MYINISKIDFGRCYSGSGGGGEVEEYYGMYVTPADASAISVTPNENYYTLHGKYLKYSFDGKTWNDWNSSVTISPEQKMYLKGEDDYVWNSSKRGKLVTADGYYNVGGDISSLTNEFVEVKEYTFNFLFYNDSYIKDASNLILPATTLSNSCYSDMFYGCSSLTTAPELPATTLANRCYNNMFFGCTSFDAAPALPATTLAPECYNYMFAGCSSFNTAPELPATTLANDCYFRMFSGCSSLTTAPELPATTLANYCYANMFSGCSSLTTAPELPATTLAFRCYGNMFSGCYSLTTAPELPATTLSNNCYSGMFNDCTSLTTATTLPATTLADSCYGNMFNGCTSLTTAPVLHATTLTISCYASMFQGCTSLTTAPELPANTLTDYCYSNMFNGCTSLNNITMLANNISASNCLNQWVMNVSSTGTFAKSPEMTSLPTGSSGIPSGWTVEDYTEYMTLSALGDGEIVITIPAAINSLYATSLSYSKDKSTWTDTIIDDTAQTITIPVTNGENVYLKGIAKQLHNIDRDCVNINSNADINASGNIMSLLYGDDYKDKTSFPEGSQNTFKSLFNGNNRLINAKDLILPATVLTYNCYCGMFASCSSLTTAPKLPATTLAEHCYSSMFWRCSSLTTAPELPAKTLADSCYQHMFSYCNSLTTASELPATTLKSSCYNLMFIGCTSLTTAPELPATTLADNCYSQMFEGCTSLTTAPELHATTLANNCYEQMFYECSSLNKITMLATDISAQLCLHLWVSKVAPTGTFTKAAEMTSLPTGTSGIPEGWTVVDYVEATVDYSQEYFTITALGDGNITLSGLDRVMPQYINNLSYSTDKSSWYDVPPDSTFDIPISSGDNVYFNGFGKQTAYSGTNGLTIKSDININVSGNIMSLLYEDVFTDITVFPGGSQFTFMNLFKNNTNLINAENLILPATTLAARCYQGMFRGCTSLATAPELPATTLVTYCYSQMFNGCTSLTTAPELPATVLASNCYSLMFNGCTSLTTAPELHATTLSLYCYNNMFYGCSALNSITMLATDISATGCLSTWVNGVASSGTFTKAAEMTSLPVGVNGIPSGWTVVDYGAA